MFLVGIVPHSSLVLLRIPPRIFFELPYFYVEGKKLVSKMGGLLCHDAHETGFLKHLLIGSEVIIGAGT